MLDVSRIFFNLSLHFLRIISAIIMVTIIKSDFFTFFFAEIDGKDVYGKYSTAISCFIKGKQGSRKKLP